jgi:ankyrin repeat protein
MIACGDGNTAIVRALVNAKADPNVVNKVGMLKIPRFLLCFGTKWPCVSSRLCQNALLVINWSPAVVRPYPVQNGYTSLCDASEKGHVGVVQLLVDAKANLNGTIGVTTIATQLQTTLM